MRLSFIMLLMLVAQVVLGQSAIEPQDDEPVLIAHEIPTVEQGCGSATVRFNITELGRVENPEIVEATGDEVAGSTLRAVVKWKYRPAVRGGVAVGYRGVFVQIKLPCNGEHPRLVETYK
jgi:TonB family protein